jgi:hypothetical protein
VESARRPAGDLSQDELFLSRGDQVYGAAPRAARAGVEWAGKHGQRTIPWGEVREVRFREQPAAPRAIKGEHVSLHLRPGAGTGYDRLEGVFRALDERRLVIHHAALGDVVIDRAALERLRGVFHGHRLEVDVGWHHLGTSLVPAMAVPRPRGNNLRCSFALDDVPREARLTVRAAHLVGPGDGKDVAAALARGVLRTEVLVNGRLVDYLNRHGDRASAEPTVITLPVPRTLLQSGDNLVELRQTADRDTGRTADCLIMGIALEAPD